jgi:hypothetical protein
MAIFKLPKFFCLFFSFCTEKSNFCTQKPLIHTFSPEREDRESVSFSGLFLLFDSNAPNHDIYFFSAKRINLKNNYYICTEILTEWQDIMTY